MTFYASANMIPEGCGQSQVSSDCHTILVTGNKSLLSTVLVWVGQWGKEGGEIEYKYPGKNITVF